VIAVSKRAMQKYDLEIFNFKELNDVKVEELYEMKI
jgi:hypothetical protein